MTKHLVSLCPRDAFNSSITKIVKNISLYMGTVEIHRQVTPKA